MSERTLKSVPNGSYSGRHNDGQWEYCVIVTVLDEKIASVAAPRVARGPAGSLSRQILPKVIATQSTNVDTISGATRESAGLLRAIENAIP